MLARSVCGEGMPAFYAQEVINAANNFCIDPWLDFTAVPFLSMFGVCKSIKDYGISLDDKGLPLIEDC